MAFSLLHQLDKFVEEIAAVLRPGRRFGMVLHAESPVAHALDALDGSVEQVDMRRDKRSIDEAVLRHGVGMVLRGDLDFIRRKMLDRMVAAAVAEFQLIGLCAVGHGQDLVTQTDPEDRYFSMQLTHGVDQPGHILGVTRPVAEKDNLMQLHSSYCVTDPKGTILIETGRMFQDAGYEIKVLNTINFKKSMHYNPFAYIHDEKDILKLVNTLIVNTKGEGQQATEDFWVKAEKLLYQAYIGYIFYECVEEEQNFITLIDMINASETREDDESFKNAIDLIFEELAADEPEHFAVKQYAKYKLAAGKTAKSILISCGARLAPFDIKELRDLTEYDEMELDQIGERKTVLFMIMSDTDGTFNFLLAMMQSQMFNLLCECADDKHHGKLPVHVRFLLDEFANIGQIPQFDKLIATIRSREISASIILQSKSQLKAIYKDNADTIEGNCDTTLFLGGKEKTTLKEMSEILGKETIDLYNTSDTRGQSPSYGLNYQKTGKELMSQDEIAVMDGGKCIMQLRGVRPFFSDKYDITKHKRYVELSDYDEKNLFDVEAFLSTKLRMKKSQVVETHDMGVIEDDAAKTE